MLEVARQKAADHGVAVSLVRGDASRPPFAPGSFDVVLVRHVLRAMQEPDATLNGQSAPMRFWRKPLHAMTDAFTTAGFRLSVISEPPPDAAARELFPDGFNDLSIRPSFLFFVVEVPRSATGRDD